MGTAKEARNVNSFYFPHTSLLLQNPYLKIAKKNRKCHLSDFLMSLKMFKKSSKNSKIIFFTNMMRFLFQRCSIVSYNNSSLAYFVYILNILFFSVVLFEFLLYNILQIVIFSAYISFCLSSLFFSDLNMYFLNF